MLANVGKFVGAKVVSAACVVASAAAILWFYNHPEAAETLWKTIKYGVAWVLFSAAMPWVTFPALPAVLKKESNALSAVLLAALSAVNVITALWLCGWSVSGALTWTVLMLGFITAAIYNFVVCESLARHIEGA